MFRQLCLWVALLTVGCAYFRDLNDASRLDCGHVLILPGIETASVFNSNIATGIASSGWVGGIEVHDWTTGFFPLWPKHLCDWEANQRNAAQLADKIVRYQDEHPGAPLHLIGHSGGGALIILALEKLPPERRVTTAILLAPAISPRHNLVTALDRTEAGIWHFHSAGDLVFLVAGTSLFGTIDRDFGPSAGAFGFDRPASPLAADNLLYDTKLHEVPYDLSMLLEGNLGQHFGATTIAFGRNRLAPILHETERR